MRRLLFALLLLITLPAAADLLGERPNAVIGAASVGGERFLPVREAFRLSLIESPPDTIRLRFVAAEGYYLYRDRLHFSSEPQGVTLGQPLLPTGERKHDEYFGDVEVYHNILDVEIPRPAQASQPFTLVVTYQGCADKGLCYPPETERLAIPSAAGAEPAVTVAPQHPAGWAWRELALFFLAGLGLTFTPCVLPMLPILSGVVLRGQVGGLRGLSLSLAYVLPMAACFALLGALMGLFGASLNLQARLQSAWVLVPFSLFFGLFALAMFGAFELKLPRRLNDWLDRLAGRTQGGSLLGAAALGVLSSLLVSPCVSAPLAGALLYISASGDAVGGGLKLLALGLGMGAPLVLVGAGGAAWLPKSGAWLVSVKNAIGVLLLGLAIALLSRVLPGPATLVLVGLLSAGTGLFLGALNLSVSLGVAARLRQLIGLLCLCYGLACWVGAFSGADSPLQPLRAGAPDASIAATRQDEWQTVSQVPELQRALADAAAAGNPVVLDWYADWCISCKVIESEVLNQPAVVGKLAGYRKLRFDITASTAAQRALLDHYGLFGPPVIQFFAADGSEVVTSRVVGEIDQAGFLAKLPR
ncbi:protein-disulfide reductase DsbD [Pseudomonas sp. RIT-PI-S]|uniref:protein-disulfide reductase DsbD n=1 Tax=Pseudomonas sp. RIT-PI-S TaxID=3035295 RepID=UPI0021D8B440|nr:protein-disulfide reductase DsbD [Pseudomonas sp. RIT-PI-S]